LPRTRGAFAMLEGGVRIPAEQKLDRPQGWCPSGSRDGCACSTRLSSMSKKQRSSSQRRRLDRGGMGQLIRSDRAKSGYKGVSQSRERYQAACTTPPCHNNHFGTFGTPRGGGRAQVYLTGCGGTGPVIQSMRMRKDWADCSEIGRRIYSMLMKASIQLALHGMAGSKIAMLPGGHFKKADRQTSASLIRDPTRTVYCT
jgi:hypothetical protein